MGYPNGSVSGKVCDGAGEALPGVAITLSGPRFDEVQVSRANGDYVFRSVPPGSYSAKAQLEGFSSETVKPVDVRLEQDTVVDFTLRLKQTA